MQTKNLSSVSNKDKIYNSPIIGNGQIVTTVGPNGYHNGLCPQEEKVNRTIFWAGRRLKNARSANIRIPRVPPEELIGPTIPLVRFGHLYRSVTIDGKSTTDDKWQQTLDMDDGVVNSKIDHGSVLEETESLVCYGNNLIVFHTKFTNDGKENVKLLFKLVYEFGDEEGKLATGTRLHIRRPHPDDLGFGNVEGTRSVESDLVHRPPHLLENLSVQYEVEGHLGEVHFGRSPNGLIKDTNQGGEFIHDIDLEAGASTELWFWAIISDRITYTHFPDFETVKTKVREHKKSWKNFYRQSHMEIGNPEIEAIRKACLYTLRCNASPWTIPPGYLSTHWEGRTFHDEFFPFMAMISSGYTELAERVPNYRLSTLPHARFRSCGHGTNYGWEVTETGEESAPYGHWVDEQFRHGQISESCWRYYLHTGSLPDLERFYPVIAGCAEWMIHDVLCRDENGRLTTRTIADVSEHVISASNSIFVASATVRALENAVRSAKLLKKDKRNREKWRSLANELKKNLPIDKNKNIYRYSQDVDLPVETAHLGMVYPFSFDIYSKVAQNTFKELWKVYQSEKDGATSEQVFSYNWIWAVGRLATICFYQASADKGYEVLNQAIQSVGPFMAPNEHYRGDKGPFLPWLTSGAGAYIHAINSMFVQVTENKPAILLPALPAAVKNATFHGLMTTQGVTVSGKIVQGRIVELNACSDKKLTWDFRIPKRVAAGLEFANGIKKSCKSGLLKYECKLKKGNNPLLA